MQVVMTENQPLEIEQPEAEQQLADYLTGLGEQLNKVNRFIYEVRVDGQSLSEVDSSETCGEFDKIEIKSRTYEDMTIDSIGHLGEYCQSFLVRLPQVLEDWDEKSAEEIEQLTDQVEEALEMANNVVRSIHEFLNFSSPKLTDLLEDGVKIKQQLAVEQSEAELQALLAQQAKQFFSGLLENLRETIDHLSREKQKLNDDQKDFEKNIKELFVTLPQTVDDLQSGRVSEGYSSLERVIIGLESILNNIKKLDDNGLLKLNLPPEQQVEMIKSHRELNTGIEELQMAVKEKDPIMVCDILEYEILPYLRDLEELFNFSEKHE